MNFKVEHDTEQLLLKLFDEDFEVQSGLFLTRYCFFKETLQGYLSDSEKEALNRKICANWERVVCCCLRPFEQESSIRVGMFKYHDNIVLETKLAGVYQLREMTGRDLSKLIGHFLKKPAKEGGASVLVVLSRGIGLFVVNYCEATDMENVFYFNDTQCLASLEETGNRDPAE